MLKEGDKAPTFCLKNQNNKEICLEDYKGKKVVLYFYPRALTPGCTTEAKDFSSAFDEFAENDIEILGISDDPVPKLENFMNKYNLKIMLLSDENHEVIERYNSWVKKKMYGKEYMGTQRNTFLIDEQGKIEKIWEKVRVKGHVADVKTVLDLKI